MQCGELCLGDTEQWFFFVHRKENEYVEGGRTKTTVTGYWKAAGSPSYVYVADCKVIGVRKSMVFYKGKAGSGKKTKWKMNEYSHYTRFAHFYSQGTNFTHAKLHILLDISCIKAKKIFVKNCYYFYLRDELSLCRVYVVSGSLRAFDL
ncbi:NAC domain-containing protein 90-like [Primulina huaijiensis]|uniref:NAC domain-containing protein 90-like n=1 Tax=Primulina huaijiensis TaxID=1492673 RepID=UPI003CC748A8